MTELAILSLVLAVASDSEGSNEEAWAERFKRVDEERKTWGVPPMTAKERMAAMLGTPLGTGLHVVGLEVRMKREIPGHFVYRWILCVYQVQKATGSTQFPRWTDRWELGRDEVLPEPLALKELRDVEPSCRYLAFRLMLPYDVRIRKGNKIKKQHFQRFAETSP